MLGPCCCTRALSRCSVQGLLFVVVCGLSLWWFLLLWSTQAQGMWGTWGLPGPGIDPVSSALAGRLSTGSPLKPHAAPDWRPPHRTAHALVSSSLAELTVTSCTGQHLPGIPTSLSSQQQPGFPVSRSFVSLLLPADTRIPSVWGIQAHSPLLLWEPVLLDSYHRIVSSYSSDQSHISVKKLLKIQENFRLPLGN